MKETTIGVRNVFMLKYKGYLYDDLLFKNENIINKSKNKDDLLNDLLRTEAKKYYWDEQMPEKDIKKYTKTKHKLLTNDEYIDKKGLSEDEFTGTFLECYEIKLDGSNKEYVLIIGNEGSGRYPTIYLEAKQDSIFTEIENPEIFDMWNVDGSMGNYVNLIEYNNRLYIQ